MEHYIINFSLDKKIVGKYPQVEEAIYNCDVWDDERFIDHPNVHFKKNDIEPITAKGILVKKAKLTDLVSAGNIGFSRKLLVSGRLKKILSDHRFTGLQFYRSPVIYKDEEVGDYWVINPYLLDHELIDFSKSQVFLMTNTSKKLERLPVLNYQDFLAEKHTIEQKGYPFSIFIEKPQFLPDLPDAFLILTDVEGGVMYIVSENLKREIEKAGITGIEFQPTTLSLNEWLGSGGPREKIYGKA